MSYIISIHNPRRCRSYLAERGYTTITDDALSYDTWLEAMLRSNELREFLHLDDTIWISRL